MDDTEQTRDSKENENEKEQKNSPINDENDEDTLMLPVGDADMDDDTDYAGKPKIDVIQKHENYCILKIFRGMGTRAVEVWLHGQYEHELFAEVPIQNIREAKTDQKFQDPEHDNPKKRKRQVLPVLAKNAVLAHPHYSAYARSLLLVARNKEVLKKIADLQLTIHCLVKGHRKPPNELLVLKKLDNHDCCIKARSLAVARSNALGHITLLSVTNIPRHYAGSSFIQPRQFRRLLKGEGLPILGSAKDCMPFKGESLCMSVVRLQFKTADRRTYDLQDAASIPPAPRLRVVLDREEQFWKSKNPLAPRSISVRLDEDFMCEDPIPKPAAYVAEKATFCGLEFRVTPAVMIPRLGSETIVDRAIALYEETLPLRSVTDMPLVLDLGTGSGCLILSILHKIANAFGVGMELSPSALQVAEYNASALGLKSRCNLYEGEFNDPSDISDEPFDIVVCNPPYHTRGGRSQLNASSLVHEPHMALFVEPKDMMKHYREIMVGLEQADMVKPGTVLVFEVCKDNAQKVVELMNELKLEQVAIGKDAKGCIRTVEGIYPPATPSFILDDSSLSSKDDYY